MLRSARRKRRPLRIEQLEDRCLLTVVYEQPPVPFNEATGWTSNKDADGSGWQSFDNFKLAERAVITDVTWRGVYAPPYYQQQGGPGYSNSITWDVSFWSAPEGTVRPENILHEESMLAEAVTATFIGIQSAGTYSVSVFDFTAHLATPFLAEANTAYWFSPISRSETLKPFFVWAAGRGQDSLAVVAQLPGGISFIVPVDLAFSLVSTPSTSVPTTPVLTVITHGYLFDIGEPDPADTNFAPWVHDMAVAIEDRLKLPVGEACTGSKIALSRFVAGGEPSAAACKHFLIPLWNSDQEDPKARKEIVQTLYELIIARAETEPIDLHLIGHSRGAVVNSEVARLLNSWSVRDRLGYVQVTTLDPHPDKLIYLDPDPMVYDVVNFADNYYQQGGWGPDGRPISGALNVDLSIIVDESRGGWAGRSGAFSEHSETHDWYHWTIDTIDDGSPSLNDAKMPTIDLATRQKIYPLTAWDSGKKVGYYWSLIGKGWNERPKSVAHYGVNNLTIHVDITQPTGATTDIQVRDLPPNQIPKGVDPLLATLGVTTGNLSRGSAISITLYMESQANSYFKYVLPADGRPAYLYEFPYDETTKTGATFNDNIVTVHLVDGSRGDDDGQANGVIVDPGFPAFDHFPWHNRSNSLDVSLNTVIEPRDALLVIDYLNNAGPGPLPLTPKTADRNLIDTNADGFSAPGDAILVIDYLNKLARLPFTVIFVQPSQTKAQPAFQKAPLPAAAPRQLTPTEAYFAAYEKPKFTGPKDGKDMEKEEIDDLLELYLADQTDLGAGAGSLQKLPLN